MSEQTGASVYPVRPPADAPDPMRGEVLPAVGQLTLFDLAAIANEEHQLALLSGMEMISHAARAGDALIAAKAQVEHGEWLPWLEANFDASERTARRYMLVASNRPRVADLEEPSLRKALEAISGAETGVHFSSASAEWSTPQDLFDELDREFEFTLDVCANPSNAKCQHYFGPGGLAEDGLTESWRGVCWMNPPYGDEISRWVEKAHASASASATVVCLVPARVDTGWWWDHCRHGEIRFLRGRLRFGGGDAGAPFPSAVVVFPRAPHVMWWERA